MRWVFSQTDIDARNEHLIAEQLRHDRLDRQNAIISYIETTPPNEPIPVRSMSQYREEQVQKQVRSILDIMGNEEDEIPM